MKRHEGNDAAFRTLRTAGMANPLRVVNLMRKTLETLSLDLSGLTVLTEAASGSYVVTPVLALLAGADRVTALTRDSAHADAGEVIRQTRAMEQLAGASAETDIHTAREVRLFAEADIVTNLGFVRPIDAACIRAMKSQSVIPLMCEAWEFRPGDLDLAACRDAHVRVVATNESTAFLDIFGYSGPLAFKLLTDAHIEVHRSRLLVVSPDKFGAAISRFLRGCGACVNLVPDLRPPAQLQDVDAILTADYQRESLIIGPGGDMEAQALADAAPGVTVVQFAGRVDAGGLLDHGIAVFPQRVLESRRMGATLAGLGPRPVIELHAAGLAVAAMAARGETPDPGTGRESAALYQRMPAEYGAS